jgi:RNA polymerase sigma-70 factor (ECF subfamily)
MTKTEEAELIQSCLRGERAAQHRLYNTYAGRMYAVCLRYCKSRAEAQDVLQEGFIKVFENLKVFKQVCPLEAWIRRIMVNTALKYLRSQKRSILYFVDMQDREQYPANVHDESSDLSLSQFTNEELTQAIQQLATGYQLVFNLFAIEGYSHKEIAVLLGISESTSKSQYLRARKHLRLYLEQLQEANFSVIRIHESV